MNSRPRPTRTGCFTAMRTPLAAIILSLCCAACGQRGPLYLPEDEPPSSAPPPEAASSEDGYESREPDDGDAG